MLNRNIKLSYTNKILEWFAFICLFGLSAYLMKKVLKQYFEGETSLLISEKTLHELPTITLCFQILGKIEPAPYFFQYKGTRFSFHDFVHLFQATLGKMRGKFRIAFANSMQDTNN